MSSNLTDGTLINSISNDMVKNESLVKKSHMILEILRRFFCKHSDSFSFRKYNDLDFSEYNKCSNCGKVLRFLSGFEEDIRG